MKVRRALISVSDKTGLDEFVRGLHKLGIEIISTGGTAKAISALGIPVKEVSSYTEFPEMLGGRVKTLHPRIHAALLALRENKEHMRQLEENGILPIDMVVVNLYPFEETISREGVTEEDAIENIDIGGPTMLRSAAKNFRSVAVINSSLQYVRVLRELEENDRGLSETVLRELAVEVFAKTSRYDGLITRYLSEDRTSGKNGQDFPERFTVEMHKIRELRYGENPHQRAAFYREASGSDGGVVDAEQVQGKELSFNNILDLNAALEMVRGFDRPAVSIVKHNNPCGIAIAGTLEKAYLEALDCDRMSAFGGIMAFNSPIDSRLAKVILKEADFVECIIAPGYEEEALKIFGSKKNLRVMNIASLEQLTPGEKDIKRIPGGALIQDTDTKELSPGDLRIVTREKPSEEILESLKFAWKVVKFVKSNAIVLCQGTKTVGIGAGQMSRVDSVIIAIRKAGERARGSVLASDAFLPMVDSVEEAGKAGITAIIQPGGSLRDEEVIGACNRLGIPMVFTGIRHFRH
ncbi:MAG: bifunctional phosphoribosylaminoimidazolecarboxamide formyltransferase/IMP cyclohydrolase [Candidatus Omnitrophota bacterium]|nr:bifunctional phosphoribosylaminoimidazolecarboxamide formyltransferase/IMP cyclohydrolase [Candidatus Omnitrophota bacterium]